MYPLMTTKVRLYIKIIPSSGYQKMFTSHRTNQGKMLRIHAVFIKTILELSTVWELLTIRLKMTLLVHNLTFVFIRSTRR